MNRNLPSNMRETEQRGAGGSAPPPPARPAAPPAPAKPKRNMAEREAPILFKFEAVGDYVAGKLLRIDRVEVKGKQVTQYTLLSDDSKVYKILGTYDIDTKLHMEDRGRYVEIAYAQDRMDVQKNGNAMREFLVRVEAAPQPVTPNAHGVEVTDEDIGF